MADLAMNPRMQLFVLLMAALKGAGSLDPEATLASLEATLESTPVVMMACAKQVYECYSGQSLGAMPGGVGEYYEAAQANPEMFAAGKQCAIQSMARDGAMREGISSLFKLIAGFAGKPNHGGDMRMPEPWTCPGPGNS
ncbi:MAG: hypothetical protein COB66_03200 [Coxiella sp. (in: Bacteria)]|nr:MAG: hypothetical protein COB66_03200 [Coxiella sp. (in: g-proteobacteria)]